MRSYARLNPAKVDEAFLNRDEIVRLSDVAVDFAGRRTRFLVNFMARYRDRRPSAIVLDNADWYRNGANVLASHGYREIPFHGFKSGQSFVSCTSLFIDPVRFAPIVKAPFFRPAFARRFANAWDQP
jgi:hypothetical protein